mgnify:FL=1
MSHTDISAHAMGYTEQILDEGILALSRHQFARAHVLFQRVLYQDKDYTLASEFLETVPLAQQTYNRKLLEAKQRLAFMKAMETYEHAPCRDLLDKIGS